MLAVQAVVPPWRRFVHRPQTIRQSLHFPLIFHHSGLRTFLSLRNFIILKFPGYRLQGTLAKPKKTYRQNHTVQVASLIRNLVIRNPGAASFLSLIIVTLSTKHITSSRDMLQLGKGEMDDPSGRLPPPRTPHDGVVFSRFRN